MLTVQEEFSGWIPPLVDLVKRAGAAILAVRQSGVEVHHKEDLSPVTRADRVSEEILLAGLARITPQIPVISEERGVPAWESRRGWQNLWLVDPLDGTREFVAGRDEFTVNLALVISGAPVFGVIYQPTAKWVTLAYQAPQRDGGWVCFSQTGVEPVVNLANGASVRGDASRLAVAVSHHYGDEDIQCLPNKLRQAFTHIDVIRVGSSLKFSLLAAGQADFYVRKAPTYEWDTAAGQAILQATGGGLCDFGGLPLAYNRRKSMLNPGFFAYGPGLSTMEWL